MRRQTMIMMILLLAACAKAPGENAQALTGGNKERGRKAVLTYGCHGCHDIPDVPGGRGAVVGPPLGGLRQRPYLARRVLNKPETLVRYLQNPPSVVPDTTMPQLGVQEQDARDMAAFLYSLP